MSQSPVSAAELFANPQDKPGMLAGLRVIEVADELGEYCGLLLAGLGAEVIKIEPVGGSPTRNIGPYLGEQPDPERSIGSLGSRGWHHGPQPRLHPGQP